MAKLTEPHTRNTSQFNLKRTVQNHTYTNTHTKTQSLSLTHTYSVSHENQISKYT